ncbi:MAG: peptidylprolyl isomerase [Xanthobacteraceae bacterium]|nr:MAG: peptidylprolyl isomerase [Xanthobacteraceae bacterium]
MLRGIRKASSNWLGKAIMGTVMGVLIISFGVWGIADIFRGFGQSTLARIGRTEISVEQFRQTYTERLQQIGRQLGRPLNSEQARAFGLDRQVLAQVVAEAALDENVRRMGLGITDAAVSNSIMQDPNFRGITGTFDPSRFTQLIRQAGYSEQRYVSEQRRLSLRRQITGTIAGAASPSRTLVEALLRLQSEQRAIEFVHLDTAQAGAIEDPGPEALARFFEDRKPLFRAPEYRKIAVVTAIPDEIAKWNTVSDEDTKKAFAERQERFTTPERREVEQIVFPSMDEARAARARISGGRSSDDVSNERLSGGLSFDDLAKERNLKPSDTNLGLVAKSGIVDSAVADAAFALGLNEVSQPVAGRFGTVLVRVTKIEPGSKPTYESMADAIKREIAGERARGTIQDLHNKMEDERGGGIAIADAAQKLGLKAVVIEAADRSGRGPDGKPVAGLPAGIDVMAPAFASDVGVENDPLQLRNGYVWFEVLGVTPSRERALDEVKDQVMARWHDDQVGQRLRAKAEEMTKKLAGGARLGELAMADGLKVETASGLKRGGSAPQNIPESVVDAAFKAAKDAAADVQGAKATERFVLRVTDIVVPPVDLESREAKTATENLKRALTDEVLGEYVAQVQSDIGTSINQTAFIQATGGAANN